MQERHENLLLKSEMDKLQEENRSIREAIKKACCPKCGYATESKDALMTVEEQQLRLENARLRAEVQESSVRYIHHLKINDIIYFEERNVMS